MKHLDSYLYLVICFLLLLGSSRLQASNSAIIQETTSDPTYTEATAEGVSSDTLAMLKDEFMTYCSNYKQDPETILPKMEKSLRRILNYYQKHDGTVNQIEKTWKDLEHVLLLLLPYDYDRYGRQLGALYMNKAFKSENEKNYDQGLLYCKKAISIYNKINNIEEIRNNYYYQLAYAYLNSAYCAENTDSTQLASKFYSLCFKYLDLKGKQQPIEYKSNNTIFRLLHSAYIKYAEFQRKERSDMKFSMLLFNKAVEVSEKTFKEDPTDESAGLYVETWYRAYTMSLRSQQLDFQDKYEKGMNLFLSAMKQYPEEKRCKQVFYQLRNSSTIVSKAICSVR